MFPIALDLTKIPLLLIGQGELFRRRIEYVKEAGATRVRVINISSPVGGGFGSAVALAKAEGWGHSCSAGENNAPLPASPLMGEEMIVMIAGLPREQAEEIVGQAHAAGKLVNVEDINDLCDFYFTANVRRGDLVIAVSTAGASPTLARKIRDRIAGMFGEEWAERLREMGQLRMAWRKEGVGFQGLIENTERHLAEQGWFTPSLTLPPSGRGDKKEGAA